MTNKRIKKLILALKMAAMRKKIQAVTKAITMMRKKMKKIL
jgi:hypothetical protein